MAKLQKLNIQSNVRRLRFNNNEMTQQALAEAISVSRQTVVAIEKGKYSPSLELAFRLSEIFGVSIEEVFYVNKEEEADK